MYRLKFSTNLNPQASQQNNGLRDFLLSYYYCRPYHAYGYGFIYGYQGQECQNFIAYPSSIENAAGKSEVAFETRWPVFSDVTVARLNLSAAMTYTGNVSSSPPQKVIVSLRSASVGYTAYVQSGSVTGNWLTINYGYGYPLRRK